MTISYDSKKEENAMTLSV